MAAKQSPPSISACLQLMDRYSMMDHIREHSLVVAQVADNVLHCLRKKLAPSLLPSKELVIAGALLHDIAKTPCFEKNCDHAEEGYAICNQHGYGEIAEIVREHVRLFSFNEERYQRGEFWARDIIYYADKRVNHSNIVDLAERLDYILEKYGHNNADRCRVIRENFRRCQVLEQWICRKADCSPEEIANTYSTSHLPEPI